jgi:hypothetical protein
MPTNGPYLKAAVLCESVIEDKQGVLSLIRVVDRVIAGASGPGAPAAMPKFNHRLMAVVMMTSGEFNGTAEISLTMQNPAGIRQPIGTTGVLFEGQDRGANIVAELNMSLEIEGLYWIEVHLGEELLTRVPMRVVYSRQSQSLPPP